MQKIQIGKSLDAQTPLHHIASSHVVSAPTDSTIEHITHMLVGIRAGHSSQTVRAFKRIPLVSKRGYLKGVISSLDILNILGAGELHTQFKHNSSLLEITALTILHPPAQTSHHLFPVTFAIKHFWENRLLALENDRGKFAGLLTEWDMIKYLRHFPQVKVRDIMTPRVFCIKEETTIFEAAKMMVRGGFPRLPVTKNEKLVGIITPYDILSYLVKEKKLLTLPKQKKPVHDIMTQVVYTVGPKTTLSDAVKIIVKTKHGFLPVVDDGEVIGILSERDIVELISE